jgi:hypothetical protein
MIMMVYQLPYKGKFFAWCKIRVFRELVECHENKNREIGENMMSYMQLIDMGVVLT